MKCEICSTDTVRVRLGNQSLCMDCYNTVMAAELGIELPELPKKFVQLTQMMQNVFSKWSSKSWERRFCKVHVNDGSKDTYLHWMGNWIPISIHCSNN